jgi:hypothetical protein
MAVKSEKAVENTKFLTENTKSFLQSPSCSGGCGWPQGLYARGGIKEGISRFKTRKFAPFSEFYVKVST